MMPPVLIVGVPRSGTSLTAAIMREMGLFLGECGSGNRWNPKGNCENLYIRDRIVKPALRASGADPMGQRGIAFDGYSPPRIPDLKVKVRDCMLREGYAGGSWGYKGAKIPLCLLSWVQAFPEARWVVVKREASANADSCARTAFMRNHDPFPGWLEWVENYQRHVDQVLTLNKVIQVRPSEWMGGRSDKLRKLAEFCGLNYDKEAFGRVVDRSRYL